MLNDSREDNIVKFCVLASGSSGNCALLATNRARILVDAGLSLRNLTHRLESIGEQIETLNAVLVTHEHSPSVSRLALLAGRLGMPVYVSKLTARAVDWGKIQPVLECFQAGASFTVGDIEVDSFGIPHDAIDPVGFCFHIEGIKIAVATDLGYLTTSVKFHLQHCDLILMESHHDTEMLNLCSYPLATKERMMSKVGHLSNDQVSDFLLGDFDGFSARLILGRLDQQANHPEIVRLVATQALQRRGFATPLEIAVQDHPSEVHEF